MGSAKYGRGKGDQLGTTELRPAFSCPSVAINSYPRNSGRKDPTWLNTVWRL